MFSEEAANSNFTVTRLTTGFEPTNYCTCDEHAMHYTTDVIESINYVFGCFFKIQCIFDLGGGGLDRTTIFEITIVQVLTETELLIIILFGFLRKIKIKR